MQNSVGHDFFSDSVNVEDMLDGEIPCLCSYGELRQRHKMGSLQKRSTIISIIVWLSEGGRPVMKFTAMCDQGQSGISSHDESLTPALAGAAGAGAEQVNLDTYCVKTETVSIITPELSSRVPSS